MQVDVVISFLADCLDSGWGSCSGWIWRWGEEIRALGSILLNGFTPLIRLTLPQAFMFTTKVTLNALDYRKKKKKKNFFLAVCANCFKTTFFVTEYYSSSWKILPSSWFFFFFFGYFTTWTQKAVVESWMDGNWIHWGDLLTFSSLRAASVGNLKGKGNTPRTLTKRLLVL